jgi:hypothetical protein
MNISLNTLQPTDCSFPGIVVPGSANYPLGKIKLDIFFGDPHNYSREKLEFKVMDWPSQYHAILGCPAFAWFMAVPHYMDLVLKILGLDRVIIVKGNFKVSDICDKEFNQMAQTFGMTTEYARLKGYTDQMCYPILVDPYQIRLSTQLGIPRKFGFIQQTRGRAHLLQ